MSVIHEEVVQGLCGAGTCGIGIGASGAAPAQACPMPLMVQYSSMKSDAVCVQLCSMTIMGTGIPGW